MSERVFGKPVRGEFPGFQDGNLGYRVSCNVLTKNLQQAQILLVIAQDAARIVGTDNVNVPAKIGQIARQIVRLTPSALPIGAK